MDARMQSETSKSISGFHPSVLQFFVVKLKPDGPRRKAELYLRCKATDDALDFTSNEPVLTSFCFPLGPEAVPAKEYMASEEYTFTLTHGDGRRYPGFCRQFLPPPPKVGSRLRYPQVLVLISDYPWCALFFKVLQVLEQLLKNGDSLLESDAKELPPNTHTAAFLQELGRHISEPHVPGQILRVPFPKTASMLGISPPRMMSMGGPGDSLAWSEELLELQVPPDCGNGQWNCGISLARLLWHVPVSGLLTLVASMLLERRIILVGQARDTVTAAVQAAAALLYPFKWHHIYLPILPKTFMDYLTAPMPFLVGLPAQMLPMLKGIPMDEVTLVDLDLGKCDPAPGSPRDDARLLPWRDSLEAALTAVHKNIRSPTEYESSPLIAGIMQEYLCKLFANYRRFVHEDTPVASALFHALPSTVSNSGSSMLSPRADRGGSVTSHHVRDGGVLGGRGGSSAALQDEALKGYGQAFEHNAFVDSHKKAVAARGFLSLLRHSQLYEVFMQERLKVAAGLEVEPEVTLFEARLDRYLEARRLRREQARMRGATQAPSSKWSSMMKKHRRTDSEEQAAIVGRSAVASSLMRRITTEPTTLASDPVGAATFNPASFFHDDDDDLDDGPSSSQELGGGRAPSVSGAAGPMSRSPQPPPAQRAAGIGREEEGLARASLPVVGGPAGGRVVGTPQRSLGGAASEGPSGRGVAAFEDHNGMLVSVAPDGHRVYEGSLGDMIKGTWSDMRSALGRVSDRVTGSPIEAEREEGPSGRGSGIKEGASRLFDSLLGNTSSSSSNTYTGYGVTGAGSGPGAAGGYRKQLTGDGKGAKPGLVARYMPQTTGSSLLDGVDSKKLKMPPPPSRPLLVEQPEGEAAPASGPHMHAAPSRLSQGGLHNAPSMTSLATSTAPAAAVVQAPVKVQPSLLSLDDPFDGFAELAGARLPAAAPVPAQPAVGPSLLDL